MSNKQNNAESVHGISLSTATGPIPYGLTNDYMFRIVFQRNKYALKGLLCSLLGLKENEINKLEITNEVKIGEAISEKEFRMDILLIMNDNTSINIEMQVKDYDNWQYRSLIYLCREFDDLDHGVDYSNVQTAYQIGILDFTLFEEHPEFFATYQMRNKKDNHLYTDKFNLMVLELNQIERATTVDKENCLDTWAKLFKAKTWEELKMIANDNKYLESTAESMYLSNEDKTIRKICRERNDLLRSQQAKDKRIEDLEKLNSQKSTEIEMKDNTCYYNKSFIIKLA